MKKAIASALSRMHARIHGFEARASAPTLGAMGRGSVLAQPAMLFHPERLFVGRDTYIHPYCRIEVITDHPHDGSPLPFGEARIEIGDRVNINSFAHLGAMGRIVLGNDVGIAGGALIEDHHSVFEGANDVRALKYLPFRVAEVIIEDGAIIGERAVIMPGVRVGRNSWVGANAVVTRDVPPYSVVAGVPARVIRRLDPTTGQWERVGDEVTR